MTIERLADLLYTDYCVQVGGKAFNGDPLPDWATFGSDSDKTKQSNAWRHIADLAIDLLVDDVPL